MPRIIDMVTASNPDIDSGDILRTIRPCSAWIRPDGIVFYVRSFNHFEAAGIIGGTYFHDCYMTPLDLEAKGWLHLSLAYDAPEHIAMVRNGATYAQSDAIADMLYSLSPDDYMDTVEFEQQEDLLHRTLMHVVSMVR